MTSKKRTLFFKYFYDFFVIMLIFVVIITILFASFLFNYIDSNEKIFRIRAEEQVNQLLTTVSDDCSRIFTIISTTPNLDILNDLDINSTPNHKIHSITSVFTEKLSISLINNKYVNQAFIYSPEKKWLLSNLGFQAIQVSPNLPWYYDNIEKDASEKKYWTLSHRDSRTGIEYISVYKAESNRINVLLINLTNLKNDILKILSNFNECTFIVWNNSDNVPMFCIGDNTYIDKIYQKSLSATNNTIFKNNHSYSTHEISEYNWRCIFEYDNTQSIKNIYSMLLFTILFAVIILLLLATTISYVRAKKTYLPIKSMISVLNNPKNTVYSENLSSYYQYSEIKYIMETILKNIHDKDTIQSKLENNLEQLNEANKYALQMQINPHFIFNTLEIIYLESYKIFGKENIVSEMICSLSDIMRITFRNDNKLISITQELSYVKKYIYIQSIRFENKFKTVWDIDESALEFFMPKLILQPIVENAIVHGIIPAKKPCILTIQCRRINGTIIFTIADNGIGMSSEKHAEIQNKLTNTTILPNKNIGIVNVNMRIKLMFGDEYGYHIKSTGSSGTAIEIILPEISALE